jgi:serine protease DegQ
VRKGPVDQPEGERSMGTGVVIVDDGTILTSLHVVAGEGEIEVVFADGTKSPADIVSAQPDQDLAVLRARRIPDDLIPATLASSRGLQPGDQVVAVGFPFGIGPSASGGVISGLGREYRATNGEQILRNLIQFDAAVNPGNSGGPLINMDGQVIGIVTALLNPSTQRVFIGIGFAVPIETAARGAGQSPF